MSRDDRLDLAGVIVGRDVTTWNQLTHPEVAAVLTALEGWVYVTYLRHQANSGRGSMP